MATHNYYDATGRMLTEASLCNLIGVPVPSDLRILISDFTFINMFAKFKPVRKSSVNYVRYADYWKANDGNCGIEIPTLSSLNDIGVTNWKYLPPRGGLSVSEPNMLSDFYFFGRYNKYAEPIVCSGEKSAITYNKFFDTNLELSLHYRQSYANSESLGLGDISGIQDMYAAVSLGKTPSENTTQTAVAQIKNAGMQGGDKIIIAESHMSSLENGTYNLYYYIRSTKRNYGDQGIFSDMKPMYHGLGYLNPVPIQVESRFPGTVTINGVNTTGGVFFNPLPKTEAQAIYNSNGTLYFQMVITTTNRPISILQGELTANVLGYYGSQKVAVGMTGAIVQDANTTKSYTVDLNFSTKNGVAVPPPFGNVVVQASFDIYFSKQNINILLGGNWFYMKNFNN